MAGKRIDFAYNKAGQFDKITRYADATGTNRAGEEKGRGKGARKRGEEPIADSKER